MYPRLKCQGSGQKWDFARESGTHIDSNARDSFRLSQYVLEISKKIEHKHPRLVSVLQVQIQMAYVEENLVEWRAPQTEPLHST